MTEYGIIGKICRNKKCIHKNENQPYVNFYKSDRTRDGYADECSTCRRLRSTFHNEKKKNNNQEFKDIFI